MVETKDLQTVVEKWTEGCIRAYLRGATDLPWITGVLRDSNIDQETLHVILGMFKQYHRTDRLKILLSHIEAKTIT